MESMLENGVLTIHLAGRVDTTNAAAVEKEIFTLVDQHRPERVVLDAQALSYISSVGLRAVLRLKKAVDATSIINTSLDVYDIFEMTGFTNILEVKRALREISVEGCEIIGQGGQGTVYRLDADTIVKLYMPGFSPEQIAQEQQAAKKAFMNGIPTAISYDVVRCGDSYGIVYEMIHSDTLSHAYKAHPEQFRELTAKYVQFVRDFHQIHLPEGTFETIQSSLHGRVKGLESHCSAEEITLIHSLIDEIPVRDTPLHCDLHPGNIMIQDGELLLIDMPEISVGPAYYDLVGIFRDLISAPKSSPQIIEKSVGLPADTVCAIGNAFFSMYTGLTDPQELQAYLQRIGLVYAFNVVLLVALGQGVSAPYMTTVLDNLLRGIVIPNEQALRHLLKNL